MIPRTRTLPVMLVTLLLAGSVLVCLPGCGRDSDTPEIGKLAAHRATSWSQLIGGPDAYGIPGDFILENEKIRVLVQDVGDGRGVGLFGGGILDADRVRTFRESCCGNGNDLFQLLVPFVNMMIPEVRDGAPAPVSVRILRDGSDGEMAQIRVEGHSAPLLTLLGTELNHLLAQSAYRFQVDYILYPNVDYVLVRTTIGVNQEPGDDPIETEGLTSPEAVLLGLLNGNLLLGNALFLGSSVSAFGPPFGFYLDGIQWEMFMQDPPASTFSDPVVTDFIAGVGKGVSYGVAAREGNIQLPLFTSSISVMVSSKFEQPRHPVGERNELTISFDNYFVVGEGDVASVLDSVYEIRGTPTGQLTGNVVDADSLAGLSGVNVFVFKDPGSGLDPSHPWPELNANWYGLANPDHRERTLDNLLLAVKLSGVKDDDETPRQRLSPLLSQIETDRFEDLTPDGSFRCRLEPGPYLLMAYTKEHGEGNLVPITIRPGETKRALLALSSPGRVFYRITDLEGNQIPGKISFRGMPLDPGSEACRHNEMGHDCRRHGDPRPFLGDTFMPDRLAKVDFTHTGAGTVTLRPGRYEWWITRGPEYTLDHGYVDVSPRREQEIRGRIAHVVDSSGYLSFDIHQHSQRSFDSGIPVIDRIVTNVAEHVEIVNATDHNYVMNYWPYIRELGVERYLSTIFSNELTSFESGHYIGFPLKWTPFEAAYGATVWQGKTVPEIFDALRDEDGYGRDRTVVHVPHPREPLFGMFDLFSLDPSNKEYDWASLFKISPNILSIFNPLINPISDGKPATIERYFSLDFESMELLNSKRFEMLRTPTDTEYENICEMTDMNPTDGFGDERDCVLKGKTTVYDIMKRTFDEQTDIFNRTDPMTSDFKQVLEDWFAYLNVGKRITATGGSDSHDAIRTEAGCPRTYIRYSSNSPLNVTDEETVRRIFDHQATMSYGPFLEFWVNGAEVGDEIVDTTGEVRIRIKVQTPGWFNVDRIEIYGNGFLVGDIGEDATPWDGVDANQPVPRPLLRPGEKDPPPYLPVRCITAGKKIRRDAIVAFDDEVVCRLPPDEGNPGRFRDTWFVVIAMGEDPMFPVYTANDYPYIQVGGMIFLALGSLARMDEPIENPGPIVNLLLQVVTLILPLLADEIADKSPYTIFPVRPWAITNPIWVDADGSGFEPSGEHVVNYIKEASPAPPTPPPRESLDRLDNPNYLRFIRSLFMTRHPPPPRYGPLPAELSAQQEG